MDASSRRIFVQGVAGAAFALACRRDEPRRSTASAVADSGGAPQAMPKRRLGRTGVQVSMLGLGGFHIGKQSDEAESIALIRRAIDQGVTFMDNCWDYHKGESEVRMGKALRDGYRQRVFLMTKLDGRNAAAATEQLEQSLRRLQVETIDLVQIHEVIHQDDPKRCFADGGIAQALRTAQKAGKLRFVGFTGHKDPRIHLAMLEAADQHGFAFDTVQMPLNVLDAHFRSFEREVLPVLVKKDIGVLGMKSLGSGKILKTGVVSAEECLRYSLSLPTSVVISGMDKPEVLEQNLRTAKAFRPLSDAERKDILARTAKFAAEGEFEAFKTSKEHDGTVENPHWLETAQL